MVALNRAVVSLLALLLFLAGIAVLIAAQFGLEAAFGRLEALGSWLRERDAATVRLVASGGAALLAAGALAVLLLEWRERARRDAVRVRMAGGERVLLPLSSIRSLVVEEMLAVPHVRAADGLVVRRGAGVEIRLTLDLDRRAVIAEVGRESTRRAEALIKGRLGVPLRGRPVLEIRYDELELGPGPATAPLMTAAGVSEVNAEAPGVYVAPADRDAHERA